MPITIRKKDFERLLWLLRFYHDHASDPSFARDFQLLQPETMTYINLLETQLEPHAGVDVSPFCI